MAGHQAQRLGDAETRLEESQYEELVPGPVPAATGRSQASLLRQGEVGDQTRGLRRRDRNGHERAARHGELDKDKFFNLRDVWPRLSIENTFFCDEKGR